MLVAECIKSFTIILNRSQTSQTFHQHIWSPTSVTNIDATKRLLNDPTYKETDGVVQEIQKHPVAFKNVATLMEIMNYLTDVSALQASGADYSGITGKESPTSQEFFNSLIRNRSLLIDFF